MKKIGDTECKVETVEDKTEECITTKLAKKTGYSKSFAWFLRMY